MTTTKHSMNRTNSAIVPGTTPAYVGIDLAKNSVHVHGVDGSGRTCIDRKMRPGKLKEYLANLEPCVVGLEACGRAHQWGRDVLAMGHEAKLMAPQFVKPYVKSNKNDQADAVAICEAVQRPNMRFVGIKSATVAGRPPCSCAMPRPTPREPATSSSSPGTRWTWCGRCNSRFWPIVLTRAYPTVAMSQEDRERQL
ncbi:MAG: transposase [Gammaproteobacteria bacterium]|nr:transposase [Gammaproteobacteria bacterium]